MSLTYLKASIFGAFMERNGSTWKCCIFLLAQLICSPGADAAKEKQSSRTSMLLTNLERRMDALTSESVFFRHDIADIMIKFDERNEVNITDTEDLKYKIDQCCMITNRSSVDVHTNKHNTKHDNKYFERLNAAFKDEKQSVRGAINTIKNDDEGMKKSIFELQQVIQDRNTRVEAYQQLNEEQLDKVNARLVQNHAAVSQLENQLASFKIDTSILINELQEQIKQMQLQNDLFVIDFNNLRNCPNGWHRYHTSCYMLNLEANTWQGAVGWCHVNNAHLVEYDDIEEAYSVLNFVKPLRNWGNSTWAGFWVGASDTHVEGTWVWETSRKHMSTGFTSYWRPGQPDDGGGKEDCMTTLVNSNGTWNDNRCDSVQCFVCERTIL